jgi:uridine phosphorylase
LQADLEPGSIVVGERAMRDEGTSYHYLSPAEQVQAGAALPAAIAHALEAGGLPYTCGAVWSTDGAYRETHEEARYFQGKGVQAVDMESAGLFALGQVKDVETASLLVVGQSLASPQRVAPTGTYLLHQRFKSLLKVLVEVLGQA